ncbi:hypothetical protein [Paenibacillus sp. RC67]|uniref:hypothetical protein n=1 Tax=Paenibacillus sp. RC67 TaxID=3039392 RepID=UPI0024ADA106|nr:hypothetical protein [Paenibacillus sp. RC67]
MSRPDFRWLRLCTAAVFDIAAIIMFVKFALLLAEPIKLVLVCVIFAVGIILINGILILPELFLRNSSFPYRVSFVLLSIVYFLVSNLISLLFVSGSIVWYTGWELFILALYVGIYAVLAFFAQLESKDRNNTALEQDARNSIRTQLMNIETALAEKNTDGTTSSVLKAFKLLKERIHASTPFGRITGNSQVMELENRVRVNLEFLQLHTKSSIHDGNKNDILKLIEETQGLLSNREALNVK